MDFSVMSQIGLRPAAPSSGTGLSSATARVAMTDDDPLTWYSPRNPLTWLGAVLLVTFGLGSVAGSVRLGKAKVSASVGKASS